MKVRENNTEEHIFSESKLLNKPGFNATAAVSYTLKLSKNTSNTTHVYDDGVIIISDCSKVISLDFSFSDEEEFDNSIFKIDTMIEVLNNFKRDLIQARDLFLNEKLIIDNKVYDEKNN